MFLDIAIGLVAPIIVAHAWLFHSWDWSFLLFGVLAVLSPDVDLLWFWFAQKVLGRHITRPSSWLRYPIVQLVLTALVYHYADPVHGTIYAICVFANLVHASFWLGRGVAWGWPFSKRRAVFFPAEHGVISRTFIRTWLPKDDAVMYAKSHGAHWIRNFYLRISYVSIVEYTAFLAAIVWILFGVK